MRTPRYYAYVIEAPPTSFFPYSPSSIVRALLAEGWRILERDQRGILFVRDRPATT